jgi:hypothetical protein
MTEQDLSAAIWHKSSYSNGQGGACIEVALKLPGIVAVRDSKRRDGEALLIDDSSWRAFVARLCKS